VKPDLLRWARDTAGFSIADAAKKARAKPHQLRSWERGEAPPTVVQLRKLANTYKRPLAAFYLPKPPKPLPSLRDFRRPERAAQPQSPQLRLAHRQAIYRREVALELLEAVGESPPDFPLSAHLRDDPEDTAAHLRQAIGVTAQEQARWRHRYKALKRRRPACEDRGVFCEFPLPVIMLNIKDSPQRRIFTMLHEMSAR